MKKQKKLVKRIIALGIVAVLVAALVAFISGRAEEKVTQIVLPEIPIISYFGITGDTTTEEDIRIVERDLNNIIMTNGYAVKLFLAPEEDYGKMIASAKEVIDACKEDDSLTYEFDFENSEFKTVSKEERPYIRYDQDVVMNTLNDEKVKKNIYPNSLSLDVVLYTDFDEYYLDASEGNLVALDAALNNSEGEMISLKKCIPEVFFNAVKVGESETAAKVYGIPTVRAVGEYEFLVFDQDLLDYYTNIITSSEDGKENYEYGFTKNQMQTLAELETYLNYVKKNSFEGADVIPLLNTPNTFVTDDYKIEMLGTSLAVDAQGNLIVPFQADAIGNAQFVSHYKTVAAYRSLGYIADPFEDELLAEKLVNEKFAVAFYTGTKSELEEIIKTAAGEEGEDGKNLVYNVYSKPLATSQEICEAVTCVQNSNGYGNGDYEAFAVNFIRLLNGVNGEVDIKNLLLYGANGVNYTLNNSGEVILPTTTEGTQGQTYSMDTLYTGHTFHAFPSVDKGISLESIELEKDHNLELQESYFTGFSLAVKAYSVKDYAGNTVSIEGVDYRQVLEDVVSEFYAQYTNGQLFAIDATDEEYLASNEDQIKQRIHDELIKKYKAKLSEDNRIKVEASILADKDMVASLEKAALTAAEKDQRNYVIEKLKFEATGTTSVENAYTVPEEDITAALEEGRFDCEKYLKERIEVRYEEQLKNKVNELCEGYEGTPEYQARVERYPMTVGYHEAYEKEYSEKKDYYFTRFLEKEIEDKMAEFNRNDFNQRVLDAFASANSERIAEIAIQYPFVDSAQLTFCNTYTAESTGALFMFQEQYYALKGEPDA
ncbi:MAG: hypothetical protein E7597_07795 [Ruminococcaceae bacterium]|nr:hypothetical protein [Oscillospiraceae bacterium]